jgi:hypothetical protein
MGNIIGFIISLFAAITIVVVLFGGMIKRVQTNYLKADTSVVITNGKADTVITKKTLPWYLK